MTYDPLNPNGSLSRGWGSSTPIQPLCPPSAPAAQTNSNLVDGSVHSLMTHVWTWSVTFVDGTKITYRTCGRHNITSSGIVAAVPEPDTLDPALSLDDDYINGEQVRHMTVVQKTQMPVDHVYVNDPMCLSFSGVGYFTRKRV